MSKGPLLLWLLTAFRWLFLTSAASELTVTTFLGQSVTLPCLYTSWSHTKNSMCWGKGSCPKSKCNQELIHTDGSLVTTRKSARYRLRGNIKAGNVSLSILKTKESDSGVYCCRIEVPGWFNDVKKNIRLELVRAPTTTTTTSRPTTTPRVTTATTPRVTTATTPRMTTVTASFPTTAMMTPEPTTGTPPQTRVTSVPSMTTTMYPLTTSSSLPERSTGLLTTETFTESPVTTEELESFPLSSVFPGSTKPPSAAPSPLTSEATEKSRPVQSTDEPSQKGTLDLVVSKTAGYTNSMIIAASVGFLLLVTSLLAFLLRGKVTDSNCLQKHKRLDHAGESQNVLSNAEHTRDDEDGLFTL